MLDIIGIVVVIAMYYVIFHDSCEKELSAKGNEMKKKTFIVGKPQGVHSHHFNYTKVQVSVYMLLSA